MRVLIVSHFFHPEVGAPQARLRFFARDWSTRGDDVTVLTGFPNHPTGVIPSAYRGKLRMTEDMDGVRIVRTWVYATPNERMLRRTLGHLSFMVSSVLLGTRAVGKQDIVIVSSPTFFSIFSGWLIARLRRARFVLELRDMWPAFMVELGVVRRRSVIRLLYALELAAFRAADAIVAVTEGFRDEIVARGISPEKVHVQPNGVDMAQFSGTPDGRADMRRQLGASDDDALVVYAGAHGITYAIPEIADVARDLRGERVHFAFVGDGPVKQRLAQRVTELGLNNVSLVSSVPHEDMPRLLAAADICLLPDRDLGFLKRVIRAKIFEYMAAARPIVAGTRGETADILTDAGAVVVPPEDGVAIGNAIRDLAHDRARRTSIGRAERKYVTERFDRAHIAQRYRTLLGSLMRSGDA
jgi:glycosyltransferase involved in cell wall biosynthesis